MVDVLKDKHPVEDAIMMIGMIVSVFALFAAMFALSGCQLFSPSSPSATARAQARGLVMTSEAVWVTSADACLSFAKAKEDDSIRLKCANVLLPAHDVIASAAEAVDTWTDASASKWPCVAKDILGEVQKIESVLTEVGITVPPAVKDAESLASQFVPQCS